MAVGATPTTGGAASTSFYPGQVEPDPQALAQSHGPATTPGAIDGFDPGPHNAKAIPGRQKSAAEQLNTVAAAYQAIGQGNVKGFTDQLSKNAHWSSTGRGLPWGAERFGADGVDKYLSDASKLAKIEPVSLQLQSVRGFYLYSWFGQEGIEGFGWW